MHQLQSVPLALPFFLFLIGVFLFIVVLIQIQVLQYAYAKLGLSSGAALLLLLASLIGSYFNIPLAELPEREVRSGQVVEFFGMRYVVPVVADWPRTVIAVNVGGALIPSLLSVYLLLKNRIWSSAAVATLVVTVACYLLAPPGSCIYLRKFGNPDRRRSVQSWQGSGLGSSIGGAGTFDGIFLTGIIAVLLASFSRRLRVAVAHEIKQKIAALIGYRKIETGVPFQLRDWSTFDV